jgi:gas vesicle protein
MNIDDASGTLFTFVLGLAVGAVVTFLFEPKSKEEVRSDVAEVMRGAAKHVATRGKSIKRRGKVFVNSAKDQVQHANRGGEQAYRRARKS